MSFIFDDIKSESEKLYTVKCRWGEDYSIRKVKALDTIIGVIVVKIKNKHGGSIIRFLSGDTPPLNYDDLTVLQHKMNVLSDMVWHGTIKKEARK